MFYNGTLKKGFPDLNYFNAPFRTEHSITVSNPNSSNHTYIPRQAKVTVLPKEEEFCISSPSSFCITPHKYIQGEAKFPTPPKFAINKLSVDDRTITEFNNHPKLKKVNSAYHLKRKIATKLQNDIKTSINSLIQQVNLTSAYKVPTISANTKEFRENVKNECIKEYGNLTVGKYICEDVRAERSSNNNANRSVVEQIEKLNESSSNDTLIKLNGLLNKTLVRDYYDAFINSNRYKSYLKSDLEKYKKKLDENQNLNLNEEKRQLFVEIYSQKYDSIARKYFVGE